MHKKDKPLYITPYTFYSEYSDHICCCFLSAGVLLNGDHLPSQHRLLFLYKYWKDKGYSQKWCDLIIAGFDMRDIEGKSDNAYQIGLAQRRFVDENYNVS